MTFFVDGDAVDLKHINVHMHAISEDRCVYITVRYRTLIIMNVNHQDSQI